MELVREWQTSGLSKNTFCRAHGIACTTFRAWCDKAASLLGNMNTMVPAEMQIVQVGSINLTMQRQVDSGVHRGPST